MSTEMRAKASLNNAVRFLQPMRYWVDYIGFFGVERVQPTLYLSTRKEKAKPYNCFAKGIDY